MNTKNRDVFKVLIPILAVIIIVESVLVVSRLTESRSVDVSNLNEDSYVEQETQVVPKTDVKASFIFSVEDGQIGVGDKKRVTLEIVPKEDFSLDAMDLYIGFKTDSLELSDLEEESGLKATAKRISDKAGVVLTNFWIMEEEGYRFEAGKAVKLISFLVEPKLAGTQELSIMETGDEVTKLVSSLEGEVITYGFLAEKLVINVGE